jgi:hypothetical protein
MDTSFRCFWSLKLLVVIVAVIAATSLQSCVVAQAPPDTVIASYGDRQIRLAELDSRTRGALGDRWHVLTEMVNEDLLHMEEARRGIGEQQLLREEIESKVPPVPPAQVEAAYRELRSMKQLPPDMSYQQYRAGLVASRRLKAENQLRRRFLETLQMKYHLTVNEAVLGAPITQADPAPTMPRRLPAGSEVSVSALRRPAGVDQGEDAFRPMLTPPSGENSPDHK